MDLFISKGGRDLQITVLTLSNNVPCNTKPLNLKQVVVLYAGRTVILRPRTPDNAPSQNQERPTGNERNHVVLRGFYQLVRHHPSSCSYDPINEGCTAHDGGQVCRGQ